MLLVLIITFVTLAFMISSILFFPKVNIGKISIDLYPYITLLGAIVIIASGYVSFEDIGGYFFSATAINPLKILVLFISMTILSVFLDEQGFFRYLAIKTVKVAGKSQIKLFFALYVIVSLLTIFTSNDIIILSFTPFICYFAKHAKIRAFPYLFTEFVAANTWSMLFEIGNPTNIYIAAASGITFIDYFFVMVIPTIVAGLVSLFILFLLFHKYFRIPMQADGEESEIIQDKLSLVVGGLILILVTFLLAISAYIKIEMWIISLSGVIALSVFSLLKSIIKKEKMDKLFITYKRAPWQLVPFVLAMFIIILGVKNVGVCEYINNFLNSFNNVYSFGIGSFLFANVINNIPMSVLFCDVLEYGNSISAIYATIVGSNLGAFLTPIGALAGIMWSKILNTYNEKTSYGKFVIYGSIVSIPTLILSLTFLLILA